MERKNLKVGDYLFGRSAMSAWVCQLLRGLGINQKGDVYIIYAKKYRPNIIFIILMPQEKIDYYSQNEWDTLNRRMKDMCDLYPIRNYN
jgi:hypothetical protein